MTPRPVVRLTCGRETITFPTRARAVDALGWGTVPEPDRVEVYNDVRGEWEQTTADELVRRETPPRRG